MSHEASGDNGNATFDEMWRSHWLEVQKSGPLTRTRFRLLLRALPDSIPASPRILDVGCGPGVFLLMLGKRFEKATLAGVEYSSVARAAAPEHLRPMIRHGDIMEIYRDFEQGAFDLIVCSEVLEHVPDPAAVLAALAGLLASGGTLLISVPAGMHHWSAQDDDAAHLRRFEYGDFRSLVTTAGLTLPLCYTWGGPVSWVYNRLINIAGSARAAHTSTSTVGRLLARTAYYALYLDDLFTNRRGFQLIARASKP